MEGKYTNEKREWRRREKRRQRMREKSVLILKMREIYFSLPKGVKRDGAVWVLVMKILR